MSAECVELSNVVFVAVPLEHHAIEWSQEQEMMGSEVDRPRSEESSSQENGRFGALFWILLGATVIGACMPFFGFIGLLRPMYSDYVIRADDAAQQIQEVVAVREQPLTDEVPGRQDRWTIELTDETFDKFLMDKLYVFINFYTPSCVWSDRLFPEWQKVRVNAVDSDIFSVGQVNCATERDLCLKQRVLAIPTIRLFAAGVAEAPDFKCNRTSEALYRFAESKLRADRGLPYINRTCDEVSPTSFCGPLR